MLPKKKRWTAAIRSSPPTCPPPQHLPVPSTVPSPGRNQWNTPSPILNSSARLGPRHQSPPGPAQTHNQLTTSVNSAYQTSGLAVSNSSAFSAGGAGVNVASGGHMSVGRPGGGGSGADPAMQNAKQCPPPPPIRPTNEPGAGAGSLIPNSRIDFPAGLITAIANSAVGSNAAELLQQQSELLLQIFPQEYLLSYAQNIAKLTNAAATGNNNSSSSNNASNCNNASLNNVQNAASHLKGVYDHAARAFASQSVLDSALSSRSILVDAGAHPPSNPSSSSSSCSSASITSSSSSVPSVCSVRPGQQSLSSPHRPDPSDFPMVTTNPIAFHTNMVSNSNFAGPQSQHSIIGSRPKLPEPVKLNRPANPSRTVPASSPVFSNSTSPPLHRFSPSRHPSGSLDNNGNNGGLVTSHATKAWPPPSGVGQLSTVPGAHHTTPQQQQSNVPTGYDLSTLSAVVRQAGLIPPSANTNRMGPPSTTAYLSQWDSAAQFALFSQGRELTEAGRRMSTGLLAPQSVMCSSAPPSTLGTSTNAASSGNCLSDSSSASRFGGSHPLDAKARMSSDLISDSRLHPKTPNSLKQSSQDCPTATNIQPPGLLQHFPLGSSRRQSTKTGPGRALDVLDHRLGGPLIPPTDSGKPHRTTPPPHLWMNADRRVSDPQPPKQHTHMASLSVPSAAPSLTPNERVNNAEPADTRFAILQDAKMAALNVDWPTPPSSGANKAQRVRSSSSFCANLSPNLSHNNNSSSSNSNLPVTLSPHTNPNIPHTSVPTSAPSHISTTNSVTRISPFCSSVPSSSSPSSSTSLTQADDNRGPSPTKPNIHCLTTQPPPPGRYSSLVTNTLTPQRTSYPPGPSAARTNGEASSYRPISIDVQHKPSKKPPQSPVSIEHSEAGPHAIANANHPPGSGEPSVKQEGRSSMPLKKRLIQRYEADSGTGSAAEPNTGRWSQLHLPSDSHSDSPRTHDHSPCSPASQNSPYTGAFPPGEVKPAQGSYTGRSASSTANSSPCNDRTKQVIDSEPAELSSKRKGNQNKANRTKSSPTESHPAAPTPHQTPAVLITATAASKTGADPADSGATSIESTGRSGPEQRHSHTPGTKRTGTVVGVKRGPNKGSRKLSVKGNSKHHRTSNSSARYRTDRDGEEELEEEEEGEEEVGIEAEEDDQKESGKGGRLNSRLNNPSTTSAPVSRRRQADGPRRTRRNSSGASSVTSSCWTRGSADPSEEAPRRRVAAVNGTLLMMVAARDQRSNSSASASSCSLHSMDADASNDEAEENEHEEEEDEDDDEEEEDDHNADSVMADGSSHSVASSTASSRNAAVNRSRSNPRKTARSRPRSKSGKASGLMEVAAEFQPATCGGALDSAGAAHPRSQQSSAATAHIPDTSRTRKPKRAAALAASAATAASATIGVKRARVGTKRTGTDETKRRRRHRSETNQSHTEEEAPTETEGSLIDDETNRTVDDTSSEVTTPSKSESATALDELVAALMEDKIPMDELLDRLPGPPNLARLTEDSLHPAHSLEYYKRSQIPFVQLVSCNDPGLKQVPKCRACRQLKVGAHYDASINGESGHSADDGASATGVSVSTTSTRDGQFKRPNGRNAQMDKAADGDRPRERDKSRMKKTAGSSAVGTGSSASDASGAVNSPVSVFCRFWGFRKLAFNSRGLLKLADFCQSSEATAEDRSLWEMHHPVSPPLSVSAARYILERSGTLFCRLLRQELAILTGNRDRDQPLPRGPGAPPKNAGLSRRPGAVNSARSTAPTAGTGTSSSGGGAVAWKRPVKGVREMCDVCETTMFNTHWVCGKCGYSVCVHCCEEAKARQKDNASNAVHQTEETNADEEGNGRDRSRSKNSRARGASLMGWSSCTTTRQHHDPERLLLTALLPACTIGRLLHRVHRIARHYQIRLGCGCLPNESEAIIRKSPATDHPVRSSTDGSRGASAAGVCEAATTTTAENSSLDLLADLALQTGMTSSSIKKCEEIMKKEEDLRDGLVSDALLYDRRGNGARTLDSCSVSGVPPVPPHTWIHKPDPHLSPTCRPGAEIPGVSVLMDGDMPTGMRANPKYRVLQLHHPDSPGTLLAFQHEWRQNRPVIVSGCQEKFDQNLWSPRRFTEDFGSLRTPLVDCATGVELTRYPLRIFWEGFERKSKRVMNKDGRAYCLKLKDWPTTDDFAELQPDRFADLMGNLPMPEYTCRDGQLNLASRLAPFFVCPDLGPKLYVAYGTGGSRSMGTTNLHVDIADAINILLYVGHPSDSIEESTANAEAVLNVMRLAKVDRVFLDRAMAWNRRVQSGLHQPQQQQRSAEDRTELTNCGPPGALWHIFLPEDMPALREFLTQITEEESGAPLEPGSDPIHDQLFYLDQPLLDRLYSCTGVLPCSIVQFRGDAVFIPAGAAHQVRNLNSCIKAAVDFVSPEHLPQCFQLIEEFRRLSNTHQNHEDKLQVKNMLFHAVKDALSVVLTSDPPLLLPSCKPLRRRLKTDGADSEDGPVDDVSADTPSAYDCAMSELFDADRLASAHLIRPSLLIKSEELDEPARKISRLATNLPPDWATGRTKSSNQAGSNSSSSVVRPNKTNRSRLPVSGSRGNSPSTRVKGSPSRPQSTGSDQPQTQTPSPPSGRSRHVPPASTVSGSTSTVTTTATAAVTSSTLSRTSLYDTHYLIDSGLAPHRSSTTEQRDFVVTGSQLG